MSVLSPFNPIFFPDRHLSDGLESRYVQTFATSDHILFEYFGQEVPTKLLDEDGTELFTLVARSWPIGETTLHFIELCGLSNGTYKIKHGDKVSYPFIVTDEPELLDDTVLLQYSMVDNRRRDDAVFLIDGMRYFYDFRVPGGFKDSETTFSVDNEDFITPDGDPCTLYSLATTQRTFTLGHQDGVPTRMAELLNLLLTCTYVYVDGVRYARKEGSTPEMNVPLDGLDSFIYKVTMQKVTRLSPSIEDENHTQLRRVAENWRSVNDNTNRIID